MQFSTSKSPDGRPCFTVCAGEETFQKKPDDCIEKVKKLNAEANLLSYSCNANPKNCEVASKALNEAVERTIVDCMRNPPRNEKQYSAAAKVLNFHSQTAILMKTEAEAYAQGINLD